MVAVRAAERGKRLAGVARDVEADAQGVDGVLVGGIDANLAEHPAIGRRVFAHVLVGGADFAPRLAAVVAAIDFRSPNPRFHDRAACTRRALLPRRRAGFVAVDEGVEHFRVRAAASRPIRPRTAAPGSPRSRRSSCSRRRSTSRCRSRRARLDARVAPLAPHALPGAAYSVFGSDGSITRSMAPVPGLL